ncbi:SGNH/GDSL hydrolase family protein [Candidatus Omnitrophota bacterium]
MMVHFRKQLLLLVVSIIVGVILAGVCAEIVFFVKHKKSYRSASLHARQRERVNIAIDKDLVAEYDRRSLHKLPYLNSASREYVEVINFKKKQGVYRIICIGGSTTQGVGFENEGKFPYILEQKLQEKFPGKFEVFNLGLHAATTEDFIERFDEASSDANFGWKDLDPDLVILCPVWNDFIIALREEVDNSSTRKFKKFVKNHLSSKFALGYYIYLGLEAIDGKLRNKFFDGNEEYFDKILELEKENFRKRLSRNIELWKNEGAKVYLLLLPGLVREEWSEDFLKALLKKRYGDSKEWFFFHSKYPIIQKADFEVVTSVAREYKVKCLDSTGIAKGIPLLTRLEDDYFSDAIHLGPELNTRVAEVLANSVINDTKN